MLLRGVSRPLIAFARHIFSLPFRCPSRPRFAYAELCQASPPLCFSLRIAAAHNQALPYHRLAYPLPLYATHIHCSSLLSHSFSVDCISATYHCMARLRRCLALTCFASAHCYCLKPFGFDCNGCLTSHIFQPPGQPVLENFRLELCAVRGHGDCPGIRPASIAAASPLLSTETPFARSTSQHSVMVKVGRVIAVHHYSYKLVWELVC